MKKNLTFIIALLILCSCTDQFETAMISYKSRRYNDALIEFQKIDSLHEKYDSALIMIEIVDSIQQVIAEKKDSAATADQRTQILKEIEGINKGVDFSEYKKSIDGLVIELALFESWGKIVNEGLQSKDQLTNQYANTLKQKIIYLQSIEFPKMRYTYGKLVNAKLWEHNIKVTSYGEGYRYILFTGYMFADNGTIKDYQTKLSEILHQLRFKQSQYKWLESASEYTYYDLETVQDYEL